MCRNCQSHSTNYWVCLYQKRPGYMRFVHSCCSATVWAVLFLDYLVYWQGIYTCPMILNCKNSAYQPQLRLKFQCNAITVNFKTNVTVVLRGRALLWDRCWTHYLTALRRLTAGRAPTRPLTVVHWLIQRCGSRWALTGCRGIVLQILSSLLMLI